MNNLYLFFQNIYFICINQVQGMNLSLDPDVQLLYIYPLNHQIFNHSVFCSGIVWNGSEDCIHLDLDFLFIIL